MKFQAVFFASTLAIMAAMPAQADEVIVNSVAGVASATAWGILPGENRGTATSEVTSTAARSGNGSLELKGDRTRAQLGIQYDPVRTTIANLSDVNSLTFEWRIAGDSVSPLGADYTPALRLMIQDGNVRKELTWEGAYNGTYGNTLRDTWYTSLASDKFYQGSGNENLGMTIAQWASLLTGATVSGISVGAGSSAGDSYHAFVDNVTFNTTSGFTTYNFETASGAVPEPASWAMLVIGFGLIGGALRQRSRALA